jgi:hypothetical protein
VNTITQTASAIHTQTRANSVIAPVLVIAPTMKLQAAYMPTEDPIIDRHAVRERRARTRAHGQEQGVVLQRPPVLGVDLPGRRVDPRERVGDELGPKVARDLVERITGARRRRRTAPSPASRGQ